MSFEYEVSKSDPLKKWREDRYDRFTPAEIVKSRQIFGGNKLEPFLISSEETEKLMKKYGIRNAYPGIYEYNNVYYHIHFPILWMISHAPTTGPHNCKQCRREGMHNGVFVAYCSCCSEKYRGQRGNGFWVHKSAFIEMDRAYDHTDQHSEDSRKQSLLTTIYCLQQGKHHEMGFGDPSIQLSHHPENPYLYKDMTAIPNDYHMNYNIDYYYPDMASSDSPLGKFLAENPDRKYDPRTFVEPALSCDPDYDGYVI